jgi:hypothetical protein
MTQLATSYEQLTLPKLSRAGLALSGLLLVVAPLALPSSYSWVEHTTSEAGAQGVDGAWIARAGFVLFAVGVAGVVSGARRLWNKVAMSAHAVFSLCMVGVAVFSARSWVGTASFDSAEDLAHSIAATVMGFAFAIGVVAVAVGRGRPRPLDLVAVAASVVVPGAMTVLGSVEGLLQRLMFAVAYLWYWQQATAAPRRSLRR